MVYPPGIARYYYARTKRVLEIPDELAYLYDERKGYERMEDLLKVPRGSVAEVLEWAGEDEAKREAALEAELAGKRRKSLIDALS